MSNQDLIHAAQAPLVAYNNKDWQGLRSLTATGITYDEVATHNRLEGIDAVIQSWQGWAKAFPDSRATFHDSYVVDDRTVFQELTWTGTHTGPLMMPSGEIPATNKTIEMRGCVLVKVADGKVGFIRQYFDMATMLSQLGLISG